MLSKELIVYKWSQHKAAAFCHNLISQTNNNGEAMFLFGIKTLISAPHFDLEFKSLWKAQNS